MVFANWTKLVIFIDMETTTRSPSRRERVRAATVAEIKAAALAQMDAQDDAALSLGSVARALGLTPPALYRYFPSREALIAALIQDGYAALADYLVASLDGLPPTAYGARFRTLVLAYREWALGHPHEFTLMASEDIRTPDLHRAIMAEAARSLRIVAGLLREAQDAGQITIPTLYRTPPASLRTQLVELDAALPDLAVPAEILALVTTVWVHFHGLIWQESHGRLLANLLRNGELYALEVEVTAAALGLDKPSASEATSPD
jgi:AcrR family transcriptional regulator